MTFELTKEYIQYLSFLIETRNDEELLHIFHSLHPADIADILEEFSYEDARYIFLQLSPEIAAKTLVEIDEDKINRLIKVIPPAIMATELIENMDSDDAVDILQNIPMHIAYEILQNFSNTEQQYNVAKLLNYDEDTAGGIMATELIRVNINWDVQTCLYEIRRQHSELENIVLAYVVDDKNILQGTLPITKLITNHEKVRIQDIYFKDVIFVQTFTPSEEVALIMEKYDLFVLPVVDSFNRLKGRITLDDVLDVVREESDRDYQMVSGITQDVEPNDSIFRQSKARLPWLLIGLVGGVLASHVIGNFESEIQKYTGLALFLPLIVAMGGNVGVQSSSIIVQSIANGSLGLETIAHRTLKELGGGLLIGAVCASALFGYNYLFGQNFAITLSVSIALFAIVIFASAFGTLIPLILHKLKIDPAIATGPFITTVNDVLGGLLYFSIARFIFTFV
ncbi:MAG: magnesium transporter [Bacteroidales bacterium]